VPRLPEDPSLEHLKKQAKSLLSRFGEGDPEALAWVREYHPSPPSELRLAGAQLVVARAYGFPSWPKLRAHLEVIERYTRSPHRVAPSEDPVDEFLRLACLTYSSDDPARWEQATSMLAADPSLARASLHAAAAAGDAGATRALLDSARGGAPGAVSGAGVRRVHSAANEAGGPHRWEPLLYLAYSRACGDGALEVARLLLDAGADANAGFLWDGLPSPFTALTGAFGRGEGDPPPHRDSLALARVLLDAGADPNDTQATYNLSWTPGDEWLELLLEFGYGRGDGGPWHARLAPAHASPRENAEDCLTWSAFYGFPNRVRLLLASGVDPDGRGGRHPILKGATGLGLALLHGHTEIAEILREAGAAEPELDEGQRIEAAYMRGDPSGPPPPGLIVRAASNGRPDVVALLLEHGADVNETDGRATAMHEAALRGDAGMVELLLSAGADATIRDAMYDATPAGWAEYAGFDELAELLRARE
jgi:ankyrin repeat protein